MSPAQEQFINRLKNVQETDQGWFAGCPLHGDDNGNLEIRRERWGLKMKCTAGCEGKKLLAALEIPEDPEHPDDLGPYVNYEGWIEWSDPSAPMVELPPSKWAQQRNKKKNKKKKNSKSTTRDHKDEEEKVSDIAILLRAVRDAEFFHSPQREAYASVLVNEHYETYPVKSRDFELYLRQKFFDADGRTPRVEDVNAVLKQLEARALFVDGEQKLYVRVANLRHKIFVDLGTPDWQAVQVDPRGWRMKAKPPVKFRRSEGMRPLPIPQSGGTLNDLRRFLNIGSDDNWILFVAWLVSAMFGSGPYPILMLQGEQGSAKSTTSRLLRNMVDPATAPLRSFPREERDLIIAASNAHIVGFDNASGIAANMADALCRLATGAGYGTRQLYTDRDEILFDGARPIIINGIEIPSTRPDLLDRSLILEVPNIDERGRRTEQELKEEFEKSWPLILGALLDVVSTALKRLPETKLESLPRMADFAKLIVAAEPALPWKPGRFLKVYRTNRVDALLGAAQDDPVFVAIQKLLQRDERFTGTATELLEKISECGDPALSKSADFPKSASRLSRGIRRLVPVFRQSGIHIQSGKRGGSKVITIEPAVPDSDSAVPCRPFAVPKSDSAVPNPAPAVPVPSLKKAQRGTA